MSEFPELAQFFEARYTGGSGQAVIALADDDFSPSIQKFFVWPDQAEAMYKYVTARKHKNVYYSPTLFASPEARKSFASYSRTVHADTDGFDPAKYKLTPSEIVTTSEGHTHSYWYIENTNNPQLVERFAHSVSLAHNKAETGHDEGWAINKLLRVPTTSNTGYSDPLSSKYVRGSKPFTVSVEYTGCVYTVEEFSAAYPPADTIQVAYRQREGSMSYGEALGSVNASSTLTSLMTRNSFDKGGAGSEALYLLYKELFRLGATDEAVFAIALNSHLNKFNRDGKANADDLLWADILRARAKQDEPYADEDMIPNAVITMAPTEDNKPTDYLTEEEKDSLPVTFIDEYMAWATSRTDASRSYHIASAFTILSCVFGDMGHTEVSWGREPLNVWFMSLGRTTLDRKSTARKLMLRVLTELSDDEVYRYELTSDFTAEALTSALGKRPSRSSLVWRDEIQSFFKEIDSKAYLGGLLGTMTDLYDGRVAAKLRSTGDVKASAPTPTSLAFYAMGIKDQVTGYLTLEDFQSGFLARFIYIIGEKTERTAESDAIRQPSQAERQAGDKAFQSMIDKLKGAREHWASWAQPTGPTVTVPMTDAALARLNKFITPMLDVAEVHTSKDVMLAGATRLTVSIMKVATLLAMYDCCDEVELPHMLTAINFAATWFGNLTSIVEGVSANAWKRTLDEVEAFVLSKGGIVKWQVVYKRFVAEMDSKQFARVIDALVEAGVLRLDPQTRQLSLISMVNSID